MWVIDCLKKRGLKTTIRKFAARIYCRKVKSVWVSQRLNTYTSQFFSNIKVYRANVEDIFEIENNWPFEFPQYKKYYLRKMLEVRFQINTCFVLKYKNIFGGALWINKCHPECCNEISDYIPGPYGMIENLFIVPELRGKKLASNLIKEACCSHLFTDIEYMVSFINPNRITSKRAHAAVGFQEIGILITEEIFLKEHSSFINN